MDASQTEFRVHTAQGKGRGKLHAQAHLNGGRREGSCQINPKEGFYFCLVSPDACRAVAPSSLGNLLHLTAEAKMTDGSTLFQGCEIMLLALHGLGLTLHLSWSWSAVGLIIQRASLLRDPPYFPESPFLFKNSTKTRAFRTQLTFNAIH